MAVKKKYLKKTKLFGKGFCTALKEKLAMKKASADSIGAAGPKGEGGGDLKGDEMKEGGSMASPPLPPPPLPPPPPW